MEWIVIADAHLGTRRNDVKQLTDFIRSLDPASREIIFLGDLFHIWAAPSRYHTPQIVFFLQQLRLYQRHGGRIHFIVGNRDIFFLEALQKKGALPFYSISGDFLHLRIAEKKISFTHGDTVNSLDSNYLRWRKTVRHPLFKSFFDLVPSFLSRKVMIAMERRLRRTNLEFRRSFPMEEWKQFLVRSANAFQADLLCIGHFHPQEPIVTPSDTITGIVVPDWHTNRTFLAIDQNGTYAFKKHRQEVE